MHIDYKKIIRLIMTLTAITLAFGLLSRLLMRNSETLMEYAEKNPSISSVSGDTVSANLITNDDPLSRSFDESSNLYKSASHLDLKSNLTGALLNASLPDEEYTVYSEGFYYAPLSEDLREYITGSSYPADVPTEELAISLDDLRYLHIWHFDFYGDPKEGELICHKEIAQDLAEIFFELYRNKYSIEKVLLTDEYGGDDLASMSDNNSSCFNYRTVERQKRLSAHAYGLAVDINPCYNPYVYYDSTGMHISPSDSVEYADRDKDFPYKLDKDDLCYRLFTEHGFIWGGNWNSAKDYQHFEKSIRK